MKTDRQLLEEYIAGNSNEAFEELVRRHMNMVFSAALRVVRDRGHAEDVSQAVFIILSKKARGISMNTPLLAWLLKVTRYVGLKFLRSEAIRRKHEERAGAIDEMNAEREQSAWRTIEPELDDVLLRLREKDRELVILRYFKGESFASIADIMGITENAAKVRATRMLEKMRKMFERRGATVTPAILTSVMLSNAVQTAPAGLADSTLVIVTSGPAVGSTAAMLAKGGMKMMMWAQVKAVAATMLAVGVLGGGVAFAATSVVKAKTSGGSSIHKLAASGGNGAGNDWPCWRGPNRDGIPQASPKLLDSWPTNGPKEVWKSEPIPSAFEGGVSSPVVAGGKVFVLMSIPRPKDKKVLISPELLKEVEEMPPPSGVNPKEMSKKVEALRGKEYSKASDLANLAYTALQCGFSYSVGVTARNLEITESVICLDAATGKEIWRKGFPGKPMNFLCCGYACASSTPAIAGDKCYALGSSAIYCLSVKDGALLWQAEFDPQLWLKSWPPPPSFGIYPDRHSSPLVMNGAVYANMPEGLTAYNAGNGELLWRQPKLKEGNSSVVKWTHEGKDYIVGVAQNAGLFCVEPAKGEVLWTLWMNGGNPTPAISGDTAVLGGTSAYKLTPQKAEKMWAQPDYDDANRGASPLVYQDHVYIVGGTYRKWMAACFDLKTGEKKWEVPANFFPGYYWGLNSPILADGKIIGTTGHGAMIVFNATPEKFSLLGGAVAVKCASGPSPAIAGGKLYLRLNDCVACYDLAAAGNQ